MAGKQNAKLLDYVKRKEYDRRLKAHEIWRNVGGRFYTLSRFSYALALFAAVFINLSYVLFTASRYMKDVDLLVNPSVVRAGLWLVSIMTLSLILSFVFVIKKKAFAYLVLAAIPCIVLPLHFYGDMSAIIAQNGMTPYFLRHVLCYIIIFVFISILFIIQMVENRKINAAYNAAAEKLYKKAARDSDDDSIFSQGDWEALLENFDKPKEEAKDE